MYKLKKGAFVAVTGDEAKKDKFMKLGFTLAKSEKPKAKKKTEEK